jgi:3-oxoacyl-[acyl-carrier protein] reductase
MISLAGRKAVITGASSGIGQGIALRFAEAQAEVALIARREDRLTDLKTRIEEKGGKAHVFVYDLCEASGITALLGRIKDALGTIDILVNNAGVGYYGVVEDMTLEQFDRTFQLNMRSVFLITQQVVPLMKQKKDGVIINIGSLSGKQGMSNLSVYCASKFALTGFSESLLEELRAFNIKVSLICPGLVNTEFFKNREQPLRGHVEDYIQSEDLAEVALLCASGSSTATLKEVLVRPRRPIV